MKNTKPTLAPFSEIEPIHYTISIENTEETEKNINLFSFNNLKENIKCMEYNELHDFLYEVKKQKKMVTGFRYFAEGNSKDQFLRKIEIMQRDGNTFHGRNVSPLSNMTAYQNQSGQIDFPNLVFELNSSTTINLTLQPKNKIVLVLECALLEDWNLKNKKYNKRIKSGILQN